MTAARDRARRDLASLRGYVRRTGLTGFQNRSAKYAYERALRSVVAVEDVEGVEAATGLSVKLRELRWEAERAGLLSPTEVLAAEKAALA